MKIKNKKIINVFLLKIKKLKWIDVVGASFFFLILAISAFFLLRRSENIVVTMRLLQRDAPNFYFNKPNNLYVENVRPGLKQTGEFGKTIVEVIDVERYISSYLFHDVFVTLNIKGAFDKSTGQYLFSGTPMLVGDFYSFKLQDILLQGVIVDVGKYKKKRERKTYFVEAYLDPINHEDIVSVGSNSLSAYYYDNTRVDGVKNYLADQITPGLKMLDNNGFELAEIVSVEKSQAKRSFVYNNRYVSVFDPNRTRVSLTLKVSTEKINDGYYFLRDIPLVVGKKIWFAFENLRIQPTITSIREFE